VFVYVVINVPDEVTVPEGVQDIVAAIYVADCAASVKVCVRLTAAHALGAFVGFYAVYDEVKMLHG
jgi:hypothetical protein